MLDIILLSNSEYWITIYGYLFVFSPVLSRVYIFVYIFFVTYFLYVTKVKVTDKMKPVILKKKY